jgi:Polysaccharide lyase
MTLVSSERFVLPMQKIMNLRRISRPVALVVAILCVSCGCASAQSHQPAAKTQRAAHHVRRKEHRSKPHGQTIKMVPVALRGRMPSDAPASPAIGQVLFNGSQKSAWQDQSASPTRVQQVPDPAGGPAIVMRFTSYNSDVWPLTPTGNPRAQLITPNNILHENQPFWESYEVYLPPTFPTAQTYGTSTFVALGSPFFGAPWNGSPSTGLVIRNGAFQWNTDRNAFEPNDVLWTTPVVTGEWLRFTWHILPSSQGYAGLYFNDEPVMVTVNRSQLDGLNLNVIDPSDYEGPWTSQLSVYYGLNQFSQLTIYYKNFKIATTQAAAEGQR